MATGINLGKIASNIFRARLPFLYESAEIYKPVISRNKTKLLELLKEKTDKAAKSELARKMRVAKGFYTVEMAPPGGAELQKLKSDLILVRDFLKMGCFRFITVKQALLLFLVGLEVTLWFFLGETIGKMHFVGYKV